MYSIEYYSIFSLYSCFLFRFCSSILVNSTRLQCRSDEELAANNTYSYKYITYRNEKENNFFFFMLLLTYLYVSFMQTSCFHNTPIRTNFKISRGENTLFLNMISHRITSISIQTNAYIDRIDISINRVVDLLANIDK